MPATERSFSDLPPTHLYLDTDILVSYLVNTQPHHERTRVFLERVAGLRLTRIYISPIARIEFAHVVSRERFRLNLSPELRERFQLERWAEPLVRQAYLQTLLGTLDDLLTQFDWVEVPSTPAVFATAERYIAQFNLAGLDALHLASTTHAGVLNLASFDRDFRRVDSLYLWNDLVHVHRST